LRSAIRATGVTCDLIGSECNECGVNPEGLPVRATEIAVVVDSDDGGHHGAGVVDDVEEAAASGGETFGEEGGVINLALDDTAGVGKIARNLAFVVKAAWGGGVGGSSGHGEVGVGECGRVVDPSDAGGAAKGVANGDARVIDAVALVQRVVCDIGKCCPGATPDGIGDRVVDGALDVVADGEAAIVHAKEEGTGSTGVVHSFNTAVAPDEAVIDGFGIEIVAGDEAVVGDSVGIGGGCAFDLDFDEFEMIGGRVFRGVAER